MPVFTRRTEPPPKHNSYRKYRQYVREDFAECCAYCLLHEVLAGGEDNFELDHFRPKSDPHGIAPDDFYNLYYSCHVCNHYKSDSWPSIDLAERGFRFVDPCSEDFGIHFQPDDNGIWKPLSPAAEYTEARLRLNRRHLVEVRSLLNDIAILRGILVDWTFPLKAQISMLLPSFEGVAMPRADKRY